MTNSQPTLSIITPAYNEARNLPLLYARICEAMAKEAIHWEWIIIDDHSSDDTMEVLRDLHANDSCVRAFRLSRNSGSHKAILCGLEHAHGSSAVIMAADLQDPPDVLPLLLRKWCEGAQVVWASRQKKEGEKFSVGAFSRLYYLCMRKICGLEQMPSTGADFFLLDRVVIDSVIKMPEANLSIFALITWSGFRQSEITYTKEQRVFGKSGWSFKKKLRLFVDSITAFTDLPLRIMSYFGFLTAAAGFIYAGSVIENAIDGHPPQGWSSIMVVVLLLGGTQMGMLGIVGAYLWRTLEESRRRPRYFVEWSLGHSKSDSKLLPETPYEATFHPSQNYFSPKNEKTSS